jgi:hypothetical protein
VGVPGQSAGERDRHPQCLFRRAAAEEPLEGQADVPALLREPVEPLAPIGARCLLRGMLAVVQEVTRVSLVGRRPVLALGGALSRELAHDVEHPEARLGVPAGIRPQQRALVEQRRQERLQPAVQVFVAHRLHRLQRGASFEDRQPAERTQIASMIARSSSSRSPRAARTCALNNAAAFGPVSGCTR